MLFSPVPMKKLPPRHRFLGCAAGPVEDKVYSFGGFFKWETYDNKGRIDVHLFNTVTLCWTALPPATTARGELSVEVPSLRYGHTAVLVEDVIYIWGGMVNCTVRCDANGCFITTGDRVNILYAFDVDTHRWFEPKVSGTVPEARYHHSACGLGKVFFIHGGFTQTSVTNDIHKLDTTTVTWSMVNTAGIPPSASSRHSATIIGTKMFVFGGRGSGTNDIRVFDTETNFWLSTPSAQLLPSSSLPPRFPYDP